MATGIDFMAIARGRQLAKRHQDQDFEREMKREEWLEKMQERQLNRQAQAYLAPMATHMRTAAASGIEPVDYLLQQNQTVLSDPGFQSLPPEAQSRVLSGMEAFNLREVQDLQRAGQFDLAQNLLGAMGRNAPWYSGAQPAFLGNVADVVQQLNASGANLSYNPTDNTVLWEGRPIAADVFLSGVERSQGNLAALGAWLQQTEQAKQNQQMWDMHLTGLGAQPPTANVEAAQQAAGVIDGISPTVETTAPLSTNVPPIGGTQSPIPPVAGQQPLTSLGYSQEAVDAISDPVFDNLKKVVANPAASPSQKAQALDILFGTSPPAVAQRERMVQARVAEELQKNFVGPPQRGPSFWDIWKDYSKL